MEAEKPSLRETLQCILIWKDFFGCHGQRERAQIGPINLIGKTRSNFWKSADVKALNEVAGPRAGCSWRDEKGVVWFWWWSSTGVVLLATGGWAWQQW